MSMMAPGRETLRDVDSKGEKKPGRGSPILVSIYFLVRQAQNVRVVKIPGIAHHF